MPYLNATISEVLRTANIGPTTIAHRAIVDSTLLGYNIKKDYSLLASLVSVNMDKKHWGDPEIFRPERFVNEKGEFVDDPFALPFGAGNFFSKFPWCKFRIGFHSVLFRTNPSHSEPIQKNVFNQFDANHLETNPKLLIRMNLNQFSNPDQSDYLELELRLIKQLFLINSNWKFWIDSH